MSLYNRGILERRHAGVFNRAHHPVAHEESSSTSEPDPSKGTLNVPGIPDISLPSPPVVHPVPILPPSPALPSINDSPGVTTDSDSLTSSPSSSVPSAPFSISSSPSVSSVRVTSPPSSPSPVQTPALGSQSPILDTASSSSTSKSGLSSGAIGAIVTLVILFVAAIVAFIVRKVYIQRREFKRSTWGAGLVPALQTKRKTIYGDEKPSFSPMEQQEKSVLGVQASALKTSPGFPDIPKLPAAPPSLYNPTLSPNSPGTSISPHQSLSPTKTVPKTDLAVVVRTFIPSLPDELNITTGEHIQILTSYDDGWALCSNMRNEQGVVPLECLQRAGMTTALQLQPQSEFGYGSDKATKRLSSLVPNANGTY